MFLKRLELQGYKTFANKTELLFDSGLTAVVGPNGSGKSNIADALRWVLGEQSFSEMRVKRGEDLIFVGSQQRARAGMATVTLTLDNSDGWLPIAYSEVEIGRKTYRSGDTEYMLNGQKVRLRDVTELLSGSGLSERNYTIIGQGMIDRALSLNPEERRALFEEAAGISHYKARRAETLRRLQETHHNLERVHDILSEIRPRLSALKRQADRARNYEQVAADLRLLLRQWYGYHWEAARRQLRRSRQSAQTAQEAWLASREQWQTQQSELEKQRRQHQTLLAALGAREQERQAQRDQLEQARRQAAVLEEREALVAQQLAELAQEWPEALAHTDSVAGQLAAAEAEWMAAQAELSGAEADLTLFEANFQAQQATIDACRNQARALEGAQREAQTRLAGWQGQLSQLRERAQEQARGQADTTAQAAIEERMGKFSAESSAWQQQAEAHRQTRARLQAEAQTLSRELKARRRDLDEAAQQLNRLSKDLARLETRRDMLDQMRRTTARLHDASAVISYLGQVITIPPAYQTAVEAALRSRWQTLLVADEAALWQLVRRNPGQALHVMARTEAARPAQPALARPTPAGAGILGWADQLVTFPAEEASWLVWLLGTTLLVESPAVAYAIGRTLPPGWSAASLDGCVVQAGGLVMTRPADSAESAAAQERQWREAQTAVAAKQTELEEARAALQTLEQAAQAQQTALDRLNENERQEGAREQQVGRQRAEALRQLEQARQQAGQWQRQQALQAQEAARLASRSREIEQVMAQEQARLAETEAALLVARQTLAGLPVAEVSQQRAARQQAITSARAAAQGRLAVVEGWRATARQAQERRQRLDQRQARLQTQRLEIDLPAAQAQLAMLQAQMAAAEEEIRPIRAQSAALQTQLQTLEAGLSHVQKSAHSLETAYTQARITLTQHENQLDILRERIHTDLGLVDLGFDEDETVQSMLPLVEVVERLPSVDALPDDLEEAIQRRRRQLQRMGLVNPTAPEEYHATQTRHDFLTQQVEDLTHTETQLRRVIRELDDLTSRAFAETVEKVDAAFGGVFKRLFGGGSAQLVLTDPENLTVSGVDIVARLPGKRAQGLGLLSGGERSLTAAALIFSLLKVSPTPFCVLDEVDAMLDEANVSRFTDMLRELSLQTQFIVITHNRGTVQTAGTLYGVSMGADGVSQVISIKPENYVARPD